MAEIRYSNKSLPLPKSRIARIGIGVLLIAGGILGFLPVLGFWMIPLGLLVLSLDIPAVRRWRRQVMVRLGGRLKRRWPHHWDKHVTGTKVSSATGRHRRREAGDDPQP